MEDVIQTYLLPYDPRYPVVCFDEACKQLFGEVRPAQRTRQGKAARIDYEYERKGVCHQLMLCEPLRGWRHVKVTERRTRRDYAECIRDLVDIHYPHAKRIRLVQDNLNTHDGASLYETYSPAEARRILDKIDNGLEFAISSGPIIAISKMRAGFFFPLLLPCSPSRGSSPSRSALGSAHL